MAERNGSALRRPLRSAERLSDRAIARGSFSPFQIESIARIGHALRPAPGLFPLDARLFACSCWHISKTMASSRSLTRRLTVNNLLDGSASYFELELLHPVVDFSFRLVFRDAVALLNFSH